MSVQIICPQDNMSFPSLEALKEHKNSGHATKGESVTNQELDPEFAKTLQEIKKAEEAKANAKNLAPDGTELKMPEPKPLIPISLTYFYKGDCPKDRIPVSTLEVSVGEKHFAIAVCLSCKEQLASKEVAKLNNDIIKPQENKK